jgi:hypothetical protein
LPAALIRALEERGFGIVARTLTPSPELVMAWDKNTQVWPGEDRPIEVSGWEVTLFNIYSIRGGRMDDDDGKIHGDARGWGMGVNLAWMAGFRYDSAAEPKTEDLGHEERSGYTLFLDPVRVCRSLQHRRGRAPVR